MSPAPMVMMALYWLAMERVFSSVSGRLWVLEARAVWCWLIVSTNLSTLTLATSSSVSRVR